jgi:predicted ATP-dependent serine protease
MRRAVAEVARRCADCGAWNSLVEERLQGIGAVGRRISDALAASSGARLYSDIQIEQHARLDRNRRVRVLGGAWSLIAGPARR